MTVNPRLKAFCEAGIVVLFAVLLQGIYRAFSHGGNDFSVFYEAWSYVLHGNGARIFHVTVDRFLYTPGFAWLLSPLAVFPKNSAFAIWCLAKVFIVGFLVSRLSSKSGPDSTFAGNRLVSLGTACWGVVMLSRPLLIDFEYGQVNLFIVGVCVWALLGHFENKTSSFKDGIRWGILTFVALAKLFPLPLLLVPWVITRKVDERKLQIERRAIFLSGLVTLFIPVISVGWSGTWALFLEWREAILARGLPLESHNQSFIALLHHYLSGCSTPVRSEGGPLFFGMNLLTPMQIELLSVAWTLVTLGITLGWILRGASASSQNHDSQGFSYRKWIAIAIGLLIVPSHLIWKPYFVLSIPAAILVVQEAMTELSKNQWKYLKLGALLFLFVGINLTGFDFVGHLWAAHFEAASLLLLLHLAIMLILVY